MSHASEPPKTLLKCRFSDPNPKLLSQNPEVVTGTLHAKELPDKPYQPELGDPCSGAVGKVTSELHTKMVLEVPGDKQGIG